MEVVMKQLTSNFSENIPIVKLFLEDIEELVKLLSANFGEVGIIADDFKLEMYLK
jgi:hypothetical protein